MIDDDEFDQDIADLRAEVQADKRYQNRLMAHPDCRDPDHPGCECCIDEDE